jgi:hypothetical protein
VSAGWAEGKQYLGFPDAGHEVIFRLPIDERPAGKPGGQRVPKELRLAVEEVNRADLGQCEPS